MLSLNNLNIVYHTEIKFDEIYIPIKIDIADVHENDYILAVSVMNQYKKDKIEPQEKEYNELDDIKVVYFDEDGLTLSYEKLYYQDVIDELEENKKIDYLLKFIDTNIIQNDIKNILENEFSDIYINNMFKIISYWIDVMMTEYHNKAKALLMLNDKNGTEMNVALSRLKSCYATMQRWYFQENENIKCFEKLSYREQHLLQSYETKMNYIDIAINKKARQDAKEMNGNNQGKQKRWSSSKRH